MITFVLYLLLVGLVAGFLARAIVPGNDAMSLPATIALGVAGSIVGGLVLGLLTGGLRDRGFGPAGFLGAALGAVVVLLVYNRVVGRRHSRSRF